MPFVDNRTVLTIDDLNSLEIADQGCGSGDLTNDCLSILQPSGRTGREMLPQEIEAVAFEADCQEKEGPLVILSGPLALDQLVKLCCLRAAWIIASQTNDANGVRAAIAALTTKGLVIDASIEAAPSQVIDDESLLGWWGNTKFSFDPKVKILTAAHEFVLSS